MIPYELKGKKANSISMNHMNRNLKAKLCSAGIAGPAKTSALAISYFMTSNSPRKEHSQLDGPHQWYCYPQYCNTLLNPPWSNVWVSFILIYSTKKKIVGQATIWDFSFWIFGASMRRWCVANILGLFDNKRPENLFFILSNKYFPTAANFLADRKVQQPAQPSKDTTK